MKHILYITVGLVALSAGAAHAKDDTDGRSSSIAVQRIMCQPAVTHTPSADTNYQPGVDVNGNPVAPADGGAQFQATQTTYIEAPLNIDLANRLGLSRPAEANANLGNLKIYNDGRVIYNGQDISQQAQALCSGSSNAPANVAPAAAGGDINRKPGSGYIPSVPAGGATLNHLPAGSYAGNGAAPENSSTVRPLQPPANVQPVMQPEVALPGTAAPSSTSSPQSAPPSRY